MPVHRYKSFEEAEKALWSLKPDVAYHHRVRGLFLLASKLLKRRHPSGVFKFRTFEEAQGELKGRRGC